MSVVDRQATFFDDEFYGDLDRKRYARREHPQTSHDAAAELKLSASRKKAIKLVTDHPGLTGQELERIAGWQVHKRLNECEQLKRICRGEPRQCTVTGRRAYVWWPCK